jgi:phage baseplate assembly protein W
MATTTLPLGITLPMRLGNFGYFEQAFDTNTQVKSNLKNFFLTKKGERPMNPLFGSDLWSVIFNNENNVDDLNQTCETIIRQECSLWFPMIDVKSVQFDRNTFDGNIYVVVARLYFTNPRFEQNLDFVDVTLTSTVV